METTRFPQISIPKPCHEDWGNMTPDARGAFCGACSKSVWDFTTKTPDEIKDILIQESGKKVCGRLRPDQLSQPAAQPVAQPVDIDIPFYFLTSGRLPRLTRFAAIALVVFGASLFSYSSTHGQAVIGKMRVVEPVHRIVGEVYTPLEQQATTDSAHTNTVEDSQPLRGEISMIEVVEENNLPEQPVHADTVKHCPAPPNPNELKIVGQMVVMGDIAAEIPSEDDIDTLFMPQQIENTPPGHSPSAIDPLVQQVAPQYVLGWARTTFDEEIPQQKISVMQHDVRQERIKLPLLPDQEVIEIPLVENVVEQEALENTEVEDAPKTTSALVNENPPLSSDGLMTIWPNPAVRVINLKYTITAQSSVTIEVYDLSGKLLQRLVTGEQHEGGEHTRTFDISALPSGAYLCAMRAEQGVQTVRFVKAEF